MAEHERASRQKQGEADQKHRVRQQESEPSFDKFHGWESSAFSIGETPFLPRMDKHAAILSKAQTDGQRASMALQLQRTYGNRYVQRLIESMGAQAKLTVSAPNDVYEQEADRVADAVTKNITSQAQRQEEEEEELQAKPLLQRQAEEEEVMAKPASDIHRQDIPEEEEVQMQPAGSESATVSEEVETHINNSRGSGQPLADTVREPMERAIGADFSGVRVHTDSEADVLNQRLSARAFTTGKDIFFREGEYSPGSSSGQKLIAHELTHVVQQSNGCASGGGSGMAVGPEGDTVEKDVATRAIVTPVDLQTRQIQRVVIRTMDPDDWLYEANEPEVVRLAGGQVKEFGGGYDYGNDKKVAFIGHGEPGSLVDTRKGNEGKHAGFQIANELRQPGKEIKEGTEIVMWSCHAGEKTPKMNFSLVENIYRWLTKVSLYQGHKMNKVKVSGVVGVHIPNPYTHTRYAGPTAGSPELEDAGKILNHFEVKHCLALYQGTINYNFQSSKLKPKTCALYKGMSLHDPAQVKLLIKQRVKNGLMPHLAPAGTTPTAADLTTYYKQELEAFFTDFENDTDFQKVASSITGGKNVLTEIGSVGP